ncbi:hypothetical protein GCM10027398_07270 [Azotobacter salinestris]
MDGAEMAALHGADRRRQSWARLALSPTAGRFCRTVLAGPDTALGRTSHLASEPGRRPAKTKVVCCPLGGDLECAYPAIP